MINNKKGEANSIILYLIFGIGVITLFLYIFFPGVFDFTGYTSEASISEFMKDTTSFSTVIEKDNAKILDYIFGEIPNGLIDITSDVSALIIIIGIWLLLLLTFGDILTLFGPFSKYTAWATAILLTIIAANIKSITAITGVALVFTAGLGALSVIVSIIAIFALFLAFNFGSSEMRKIIIKRRAEDKALEATAGGTVAASGINILKKIVKEAKK